MSDVAAAPPSSTKDTSGRLSSSPANGVGHPTKTIPSDEPEPSTVTNGPAGQPLHAKLADSSHTEPSPNADQTAGGENDYLHDRVDPDKEDEELYGTADKPDGDPDTLVTPTKSNDYNSDDDPFAGLEAVATMDLYDLANYTFGKKNEECKSRLMQDLPAKDVSAALEARYHERGMRRTVGAVILVHSHNFPHILLLQRHDGKGEYALPGGRLRPGESEEEGLQRKLTSKLKPSGAISADEDEQQQLDVGDKLCTWHAIDFSRKFYPYVPAHVTKPKEELNIYAVSIPSKFMFAVPNNLQLVAVPLFELFNNASTYGDIISSVPALLSRYHVNYC